MVAGQQALTIQQTLDLALQHHTAGRLPQAESFYQRILQTDPRQPVALHLLGVIAQQMGKSDVAVDLITKALAIKPDYAMAQNNLGNALKDLGKLDEAVVSYRNAVAVNPELAEVHHNLGNVLNDLGKPDDAAASHHRALAIKPDYAEAHSGLGNALQALGKVGDAVVRYDKALAIKPEYAMAHNNLGLALLALGKLDEAMASYAKAIAIKPEYAEAHRLLALLRKSSEYDSDIKAMEATYATPGLGDEQKMHLAFGLGKSFEDLRQYEKAFGHFLTGNAIKHGTYEFAIEDVEKYFERLKQLFTKDLFGKNKSAGSSDGTPIFVVGMPRTGTTLVEQVLASHPNVFGAGELDDLNRIVTSHFGAIDDVRFIENINQANTGEFSRAGDDYIGMIRERAETADFITDKMPDNFRLIGMIKLLMPNAKIIHCRRDPRDTCLSIFKTLFTIKGHYYAYDLGLLGQYYNLYRDLMTHWHSVLPGFIYDIHYEDVVADQEPQSRALLAYCGLEWDDACLEFHKTNRPVQTASAAQTRRPMYKDSIQSWKRFEKWLAPLLDELN